MSERETILHVFDALGGAKGLIEAAKASPSLQAEFYKNIYTKLIPNKADLEAQERFSDDGRELLSTIEQVRDQVAEKTALLRYGPKNRESEPGLSRDSDKALCAEPACATGNVDSL
jgi:hypothetical protein